MTFNHNREYEAHLILGDPAVRSIWYWDRWVEVFSLLSSLAKTVRGAPVTRSDQFEATSNKPVQFGRIAWSREGHRKWTHSPETTHRFLGTEVWAPSRGVCTRDGQPPDLLFVIWNQGFFTKDSLTFRDVVLLAVPSEDDLRVTQCLASASRIADTLQARFHGRIARPWALPYGSAMFTDSLGGMPTTGLFRVGPVYCQTPGNEILQEHWELC